MVPSVQGISSPPHPAELCSEPSPAAPSSAWDGTGGILELQEYSLEKEVAAQREVRAIAGPGSGKKRVKIVFYTNFERPLLLHWGVVAKGRNQREWRLPLPANRPANTVVYKMKALQTPFEVREQSTTRARQLLHKL